MRQIVYWCLLLIIICATARSQAVAQTTYALIGKRETASSADTIFSYYELYDLDVLTGQSTLLATWGLADFDPDQPVLLEPFEISAFTYDSYRDLFFLISARGQLYSYDRSADQLTLIEDLIPNTSNISDMSKRAFFHIEVYGRDSLYLGGSQCGFFDLATGMFSVLWEYDSFSNNGDPLWGRLLVTEMIEYKGQTLAFTAGTDAGIGEYDRFNYLTPPDVLPNYVRGPSLPFNPNILQYTISCDSIPVLMVQSTSVDSFFVFEVEMETATAEVVLRYPIANPAGSVNRVIDVFHIPARTWQECQVFIDLDEDDSTAPDLDYLRDSICGGENLLFTDQDIQISNERQIDSVTIDVISPSTGYTLDIPTGNYQVSMDTNGAVLVNTGTSTDEDYEGGLRLATLDVDAGIDSVVINVQVWANGQGGRIATAYLYLGTDQLTAGPDQAVHLCPGDDEQDLSDLVPAGGLWSSDPVVDPSSDSGGDYVYTVASACGSDTAVISVTISPEASAVNIDTLLCVGESIEINGTTYSSETAFMDRLQDAQGCDSLTYDVRIVYLPAPETITSDTSLCAGDTIILGGAAITSDTLLEECVLNVRGCDSIVYETIVTVTTSDSYALTVEGSLCDPPVQLAIAPTPASIDWSTAGLPEVSESGTYSATVTDGNGCTAVVITEVPEADIPSLSGEEDYVFYGRDTTFTTNLVSDAATIAWSPSDGLSCADCLSPTIAATGDITYTVTATSEQGCETVRTITITQQRSSEPIQRPTLPNIFNPESTVPDNRRFYLSSTSIDTYSMVIYDRWGNVVYSGEDLRPGDPNQGWDGSHHGDRAVSGIYVYTITYEVFGEVEQVVGTVAVVR